MLLSGAITSAARSQGSSRDSASVRIFDYRFLAAAPLTITVSDSPFVRFRGSFQQGSHILGPMAMRRLRDHRIAIGMTNTTGLNSPAILALMDSIAEKPERMKEISGLPPFPPSARVLVREVRLYDSTGKFIRSFGRAGTEPEDFAADVTYISERPDGRLLIATKVPGYHIFESSGAYFHGVSGGVLRGRVGGFFDDGRSLIATSARVKPPAGDLFVENYRVWLDSAVLSVEASEGKLSRLPIVTKRPFLVDTNPPQPGAAQRPLLAWPLANPENTFVGHDVIWTADLVSWEFRVYDIAGQLRAIVRPPIPPSVRNSNIGDRFLPDELAGQMMLADDAGRFWMDTGDNPLHSKDPFTARKWWVFDPSGRLVSSVVMPAGFRPYQITDDILLGSYLPSKNLPMFAALFRFGSRAR